MYESQGFYVTYVVPIMFYYHVSILSVSRDSMTSCTDASSFTMTDISLHDSSLHDLPHTIYTYGIETKQ